MSKSKSIKSNVIYEDGFFMGEKDIKIYYKKKYELKKYYIKLLLKIKINIFLN